MSNVMGNCVKFTKTTHKKWSCHVMLASNPEDFYFSPNSALTLSHLGVSVHCQPVGGGGRYCPPSITSVSFAGK